MINNIIKKIFNNIIGMIVLNIEKSKDINGKLK